MAAVPAGQVEDARTLGRAQAVEHERHLEARLLDGLFFTQRRDIARVEEVLEPIPPAHSRRSIFRPGHPMSRLHDAARTEARTIGVSVILSAGLRRLLPGSPDGPRRHTLAAGANLGDLLAALGITAATDLTAAVDGELADHATRSATAPRSCSSCRWKVAVAGGAAAEGEATIRKAVKGFCSKRQQRRRQQQEGSSKDVAARPLTSHRSEDNEMAQLRIPLDEKRFNSGQTWKDYMAQMGDTRAKTEGNYANSKLTDEERKFFGSVNGVKYVVMLAENWCGDVHRNSPLIAHIVEAMPGAELRVFLRDQNADLRDAFLNNGYQSIPVVVFFDKDWNEIGRWLERAHGATTASSGIRARTLGAVPQGASKEQQDAAMNEFRAQVQAEYDKPGGALWRAAAAEVKLLLETRLGAKK